MNDISSQDHHPVIHVYAKTPCCLNNVQLLAFDKEPSIVRLCCKGCGREWKTANTRNPKGLYNVIWRQLSGAKRISRATKGEIDAGRRTDLHTI